MGGGFVPRPFTLARVISDNARAGGPGQGPDLSHRPQGLIGAAARTSSSAALRGVVRNLPTARAADAFDVPVAVTVMNPQDGPDDYGIGSFAVLALRRVAEGGWVKWVEPRNAFRRVARIGRRSSIGRLAANALPRPPATAARGWGRPPRSCSRPRARTAGMARSGLSSSVQTWSFSPFVSRSCRRLHGRASPTPVGNTMVSDVSSPGTYVSRASKVSASALRVSSSNLTSSASRVLLQLSIRVLPAPGQIGPRHST